MSETEKSSDTKPKVQRCETCKTFCVGDEAFEKHLQSQKHKDKVEGKTTDDTNKKDSLLNKKDEKSDRQSSKDRSESKKRERSSDRDKRVSNRDRDRYGRQSTRRRNADNSRDGFGRRPYHSRSPHRSFRDKTSRRHHSGEPRKRGSDSEGEVMYLSGSDWEIMDETNDDEESQAVADETTKDSPGETKSDINENSSDKNEGQQLSKESKTDAENKTNLSKDSKNGNKHANGGDENSKDKKTVCESCKMIFSNKHKYDQHCAGSKHKENTAGPNKKVAKIQGQIDRCSEPLLGLSLVLEVSRPLTEPLYRCILCNLECIGKTVMSHLTGNKHFLSYIQAFHPDLLSKLPPKKKVGNEVFEIFLKNSGINIEKEKVVVVSGEKEATDVTLKTCKTYKLVVPDYKKPSGEDQIFTGTSSAANDAPKKNTGHLLQQTNIDFSNKLCPLKSDIRGKPSTTSCTRVLSNMKKLSTGTIKSSRVADLRNSVSNRKNIQTAIKKKERSLPEDKSKIGYKTYLMTKWPRLSKLRKNIVKQNLRNRNKTSSAFTFSTQPSYISQYSKRQKLENVLSENELHNMTRNIVNSLPKRTINGSSFSLKSIKRVNLPISVNNSSRIEHHFSYNESNDLSKDYRSAQEISYFRNTDRSNNRTEITLPQDLSFHKSTLSPRLTSHCHTGNLSHQRGRSLERSALHQKSNYFQANAIRREALPEEVSISDRNKLFKEYIRQRGRSSDRINFHLKSRSHQSEDIYLRRSPQRIRDRSLQGDDLYSSRSSKRPELLLNARSPQRNNTHLRGRSPQRNDLHLRVRSSERDNLYLKVRSPQRSDLHLRTRSLQKNDSPLRVRSSQRNDLYLRDKSLQRNDSHLRIRSPQRNNLRSRARSPQGDDLHLKVRSPPEDFHLRGSFQRNDLHLTHKSPQRNDLVLRNRSVQGDDLRLRSGLPQIHDLQSRGRLPTRDILHLRGGSLQRIDSQGKVGSSQVADFHLRKVSPQRANTFLRVRSPIREYSSLKDRSSQRIDPVFRSTSAQKVDSHLSSRSPPREFFLQVKLPEKNIFSQGRSHSRENIHLTAKSTLRKNYHLRSKSPQRENFQKNDSHLRNSSQKYNFNLKNIYQRENLHHQNRMPDKDCFQTQPKLLQKDDLHHKNISSQKNNISQRSIVSQRKNREQSRKSPQVKLTSLKYDDTMIDKFRPTEKEYTSQHNKSLRRETFPDSQSEDCFLKTSSQSKHKSYRRKDYDNEMETSNRDILSKKTAIHKENSSKKSAVENSYTKKFEKYISTQNFEKGAAKESNSLSQNLANNFLTETANLIAKNLQEDAGTSPEDKADYIATAVLLAQKLLNPKPDSSNSNILNILNKQLVDTQTDRDEKSKQSATVNKASSSDKKSTLSGRKNNFPLKNSLNLGTFNRQYLPGRALIEDHRITLFDPDSNFGRPHMQEFQSANTSETTSFNKQEPIYRQSKTYIQSKHVNTDLPLKQGLSSTNKRQSLDDNRNSKRRRII